MSFFKSYRKKKSRIIHLPYFFFIGGKMFIQDFPRKGSQLLWSQ